MTSRAALPIALLFAGAFLVPSSGAHASACSPAGQTEVLSAALAIGLAIGEWADQQNIAIPDQVRWQLVTDFCAVARELARQRQMPLSTFDRYAAATIIEFLDRSLAPNRPARSMDSILASRAGLDSRVEAPAFSPPRVKVYGFISVRANPPLTTLRIGDTAVPVRPRVMFCAGRTTVVGFRGSQEACRADLEIVAGTEVRFDC